MILQVKELSLQSCSLLSLTNDEGGYICNGEVEKVGIGGGPHVLVTDDDDAGGQVATHTNNQEDAVDDGEGDEGGPVDMGVTECCLNESCYVFIHIFLSQN